MDGANVTRELAPPKNLLTAPSSLPVKDAKLAATIQVVTVDVLARNASAQSNSSLQLHPKVTLQPPPIPPKKVRYEGEHLNGKRHGIGKLFFANRVRYEGEFFNNKPHGRGVMFCEDGRYEGEFLDGQMFGQGKFFFVNGDKYEGEFRNKPHGRGVMFCEDGRYEGEFLDGQMFGQGKFFFVTGDKYEGEFRNNKQHGRGVIIYKNGNRFEGEFVEGQMRGQGKLIFFNGEKYEGEFLNGQTVRGTYFFNSGNRYEGEFLGNKLHGRGIYISDGGTTSELEFVNDYPISDISHLSDSLFLQLLSQKFYSTACFTYPLGIMAHYLITMGYKEAGHTLKGAQQSHFFCTTPATQQTKAEEIYYRLQTPNQPVLLALETEVHVLGLQMRQTVTGFVDFEIYNSGGGLAKFHKRHPQKQQKYQTVWKRRVSLITLTPDHLKQFLEQFFETSDIYRAIQSLPDAQEIAAGKEPVIWQKLQQGKNCTLMWIFAYLKNNMAPQDYINMCAQLHTRALEAAEAAEVPNQKLIDSLKEKANKLLRKSAALV